MKDLHAPSSSDVAIDFLKLLRPQGPWSLSAFAPDGEAKTITETVGPETEANARHFIERWNGKRNVYFSVNPTRGVLQKKAKRTDIERVEYLHVDVDPCAGEDLETEQQRILRWLTSERPPDVPLPTAIIFSGGGYQALWKLETPIVLNGTVDQAEQAARLNKWLEKKLGGDNCHNVDRVLRLPGTLNLPNAKKRAAGRKPAMAMLVEADWTRVYPFELFGTTDEPSETASTPTSASDAVTVAISETIPALGSVDDLDRWGVPPRIKTIITEGCHPDEDTKPQSDRSRWVYDVLCGLVRCRVPDDVMFAVITDDRFKISEHVLEKPDVRAYAIKQIERAKKAVAEDAAPENTGAELVLHASRPLISARELLQRRLPNALRTNGTWYDWRGGAYLEIEEGAVRAAIYAFLETAVTLPRNEEGGEGGMRRAPFNPTASKVSNVVDALQAIVHHDAELLKPPVWRMGEGPDPRELLSFCNGLFHLPSGDFAPPTSRFFTHNALGFEYQPTTPQPVHWLKFLRQIWGDGPEISLLQEIFGYCLVPDTRQQKIFLLVGPKRAGKGTIAAILTQLVGERNVCSPSLNNIGGTFALQPLIGKQLAIVSDMRIGYKTDMAAVAEYLLGISGEDGVTVHRKYQSAWTGRLSVRFFIMTNEMPRLQDASAVVASRFVPLVMENSFFGQEDLGLRDRLMTELPSILNWAIEGWRRLQSRGRFELPQRSLQAIEELEELATPVRAFQRECCELEPNAMTLKSEIWSAWQVWCGQNNEHVGNQRQFFRNLVASTGRVIKPSKPKLGDTRQPCYLGIRLQPDQPEM